MGIKGNDGERGPRGISSPVGFLLVEHSQAKVILWLTIFNGLLIILYIILTF